MLETLVQNQIIFYAMGVAAGIGVLSKLVAHITLRRMVKAASRMNKSNHKLMRLVRAKFEHASMVAIKCRTWSICEKVMFMEYRIWGTRLHTFRNLEKKMTWIVAVLGVAGTVAVYYLYGFEDQVFKYAAWTGASVAILCMIHMSSDENYHLQMAENYMVDYLENVCAHRYAKLYKEKAMSQTSILEMEEAFQPEAEEEVVAAEVEEIQEEPVSEQEPGICHEAGRTGKRRKSCSGRKKTAGSAGAQDFRRIFGIDEIKRLQRSK